MMRLKVAIARLLQTVSRRLGRRGGTTLPGRVLLSMDAGTIAVLGKRLERGSVLVSATNGKTTTSAMLAAVLESAGARVVHNRAGSNMNWGVATALLDAESLKRQAVTRPIVSWRGGVRSSSSSTDDQ